MKPRITKAKYSDYWEFYCYGVRADGIDASGFGHTFEQAYQGWLDFQESDIPF